MTDNEIIKALQCCIDCKCKECPCYKSIDGEMHCTEIDEEEIVRLINRLQAENEENENIIRLADKAIETANAEIERMKNQKCLYAFDGEFEDCIKAGCFYRKKEDEVKSEAIKEFAEKLKNCFAISRDYLDIINIIENLVEEMTEENEK